MHYRAISNKVSHLEVLRCEQSERINTANEKDGLTSFPMSSVLEAIFIYGVLEEHKLCVNNRY